MGPLIKLDNLANHYQSYGPAVSAAAKPDHQKAVESQHPRPSFLY